MENNAIKEANRKAMPKFILLTIICVIIGGTGGYLSARFSLNTCLLYTSDAADEL